MKFIPKNFVKPYQTRIREVQDICISLNLRFIAYAKSQQNNKSQNKFCGHKQQNYIKATMKFNFPSPDTKEAINFENNQSKT